MSNFQITIIPAQGAGGESQTEGERFGIRQHGRGAGKIIEGIEALSGVWDQVIQKLTALASQSQTATSPSQYELSSIEFNIGIEAGLSIGLVTKADASVSFVFKKNAGEGKPSG